MAGSGYKSLKRTQDENIGYFDTADDDDDVDYLDTSLNTSTVSIRGGIKDKMKEYFMMKRNKHGPNVELKLKLKRIQRLHIGKHDYNKYLMYKYGRVFIARLLRMVDRNVAVRRFRRESSLRRYSLTP